jgi:hypothetical protein
MWLFAGKQLPTEHFTMTKQRAAYLLWLTLASLCVSPISAQTVTSTLKDATLEFKRSGDLLVTSEGFLLPDNSTPAHYANLGMRFIRITCDGETQKVLASKISDREGTRFLVFAGQHCVEKSTKQVEVIVGQHTSSFEIGLSLDLAQ